MIKGLLLIEKPARVCEGCILGKKHRESFPASMSMRDRKTFKDYEFGFVWTMQTPSIGGINYFLSFIDDYSSKTWVYILKDKDGIFV